MKKSSNHLFELNRRHPFFDGLFTVHRFAFVTFEILIVFISLLIVSTSSFVIYRITKAHKKNKQNRNRSNFAFISLSVSDIAVGLFSVPLYGIRWFYVKDSQILLLMFTAGTFLIEFPFSFSCLTTAVMAVDRVFVITLAQKYENIVTLKTLKVITIILLLFGVTISSITAWNLHVMAKSGNISWTIDLVISDFILKVVTPVLVIPAHLYILNFALKRRDLKQLRIHHHKNHNRKRLVKTIIYICISQLIFALPYLIFYLSYILFMINTHKTYSLSLEILYTNIDAWLKLLPYCQCFSNAIIILLNQKKQKISKPIDKEPPLRNDKSRMETRL